MNKGNAVTRSSGLWTTILLGAAAFLLVLAVVSAPESAFQASLQALKLWWNIVFPALLPFLVLAEIIFAYGWAHGVGVFLDPFMRKTFNLPGAGGWVLITGMTAGFPAGAQASATMIKQGHLSPGDAERLAALSHFCNPMTILIVIGTGLLHQPAAGYLLLGVHWAAGLLAAWTYSLKRKKAPDGKNEESSLSKRAGLASPRISILRRAANAASEARARDGRSFGRLLGDSVSRSVQTLMMTGGFIMIFAVIVKVLSGFFLSVAPPFVVAGLLEMHIGAKTVSESSFTGLGLQMALLSAVLAWSGISAHLQSLSALKISGPAWGVFAVKRLWHAFYAFCLTLILWKPAGSLTAAVLPAFGAVPHETLLQEQLFSLWSGFHILLQWQILTFIILTILFWLVSKAISRRSL